jgi:hypothetical protein
MDLLARHVPDERPDQPNNGPDYMFISIIYVYQINNKLLWHRLFFGLTPAALIDSRHILDPNKIVDDPIRGKMAPLGSKRH